MKTLHHIAVIILAAGSSQRLGSPKQLLRYKNTSLLRHITQTALLSRGDKVLVVVAYRSEEMQKELTELDVEIVQNPDWKSGISSSLRAGVTALGMDIDAAIILICDQPKVTSSLINTLIESYTTSQQPIIACRYGDIVGVPALFDRKIFNELKNLKGDVGAKSIIEHYASERMEIGFPGGEIDIDTITDQARLD